MAIVPSGKRGNGKIIDDVPIKAPIYEDFPLHRFIVRG
jgi:hypothetical protein